MDQQKVRQIYNGLALKFDARDKLYELLQKAHDEGHKIPLKYLKDWNAYQKDKRKWKDIPGQSKRLWKIAKLYARNENLSRDKRNEMSLKYLDKQLKKLGR